MFKTWERTDYYCTCYRTTKGAGSPDWSKVFKRDTYALDTAELIKSEDVLDDKTSPDFRDNYNRWNRRLPKHPRSIRTVLHYADDKPKEFEPAKPTDDQ